jgi:elongation factor G
VNSGTDRRGATSIITGEVPLSSMFDYANELRSMTQGKGTFSMEFLCYRPMPRSLQEEVIIRRREEKKEQLALA